jgi:hypothetical protein
VISEQHVTTSLGPNGRSHQHLVQVRWISLIGLALCGSLVDAKPTSAGFTGLVSFAEGEPFTIVRHDTLMTGSKGVPLLAGDFIETGPSALLVIAGSEGTLIGLGPFTHVYFIERAEVTTLFVLKGWVKADVKSGPIRILGTRLGIQGHQAVMLLSAEEQSDAVFDEQGATTILLAEAASMLVGKETGTNHFFLREDRREVVSRPSPSVEFVEKMPVAFRDPLPGSIKLPEPVPPRVVRAVTYSDIQTWLTIPRERRDGFIGRFRGRLKDPAFFAAMDAHQALFPEWKPILHPPPLPAADGSTDESRSEGKSVPDKSEPKKGDESR